MSNDYADTVLILNHNGLGQTDTALGHKLATNYFRTLIELEQRPKAITFTPTESNWSQPEAHARKSLQNSPPPAYRSSPAAPALTTTACSTRSSLAKSATCCASSKRRLRQPR